MPHRRSNNEFRITPEVLLKAYSVGIFPMSEDADDPNIHWVDPALRGIIPLEEFHASRSLIKTIRRSPFEIRVDTAFLAVVDACAEPSPGRGQTWINSQIRDLYGALHAMGFAHSVEAWEGEQLVGGLYGVSLGAAFFGESMFSRKTDASKVPLAYLWDRLLRGNYTLLDTQFLTSHLSRFGAIEIARDEYQQRLHSALQREGNFYPAGAGTAEAVLQSLSQTS